MKNSSLRVRALKVAIALTAGFSPILAAQQAPAVEQRPRAMALDEVVVTAQRRAESLQDTPISLAVFDSEALEKRGIGGLDDLQGNVPGLAIQPFPIDATNLRIFIRGVGLLDSQVTQDPPVGVYIDDVYISRSAGLSLEMADLERIEVLRGPQGTLYGRNAVGGAVNLVTRRPNPTAFSFQQKLTAGNRNLFSSQTSVNVPVTDNAAFKVSYLYKEKDGFVKNTGEGGNFGDRSDEGLRLDLRWDVTDRLTIDVAYDRTEVEYFLYTYQPVRPASQIPNPDNDTSILFLNGFARESREFIEYSGSDKLVRRLHTPTPLRKSFNEIEGASLRLTWDLDFAQLKYIGAWRSLLNVRHVDLSTGSTSTEYRIDYGAVSLKDGSQSFPAQRDWLKQDQYSHELQLQGELFNQLDYVVGVYYFEEDGRDGVPSPALRHSFTGPFQRNTDPVTGLTTTQSIKVLNRSDNWIDNTATALYGRLGWRPPVLQDRLELILGYRHSRDNRKARRIFQDVTFLENAVQNSAGQQLSATSTELGSTEFDASGDEDFRDDSFDFIAQYDVTDEVRVYGKVSEAYKSGGFNIREPDEDFFSRGFNEEKARAYELGTKSELFNRRMRLNANVFFTEFTDLQMNLQLPGSFNETRVFNAGEAETYGFEMTGTLLVSPDLLIQLDYSYLRGEFTKVINPINGENQTDDFVFVSLPKHSGVIAMDYTIGYFSWGHLSANANVNYSSERVGEFRADVRRQMMLSEYKLLNARLTLADIPVGRRGDLTLALWGKNITDEEYVIDAVASLPSAARAVIFGEPRSYGLDAVLRF